MGKDNKCEIDESDGISPEMDKILCDTKARRERQLVAKRLEIAGQKLGTSEELGRVLELVEQEHGKNLGIFERLVRNGKLNTKEARDLADKLEQLDVKLAKQKQMLRTRLISDAQLEGIQKDLEAIKSDIEKYDVVCR